MAGYMINLNLITNVTFHNAITTATNGIPVVIGSYKTLTLEIYGTNTSVSVSIHGILNSGVKKIMTVFNKQDFNAVTNITINNSIWELDISGLEYVEIDVDSVTGGNVTIRGNFIT